VPLSGFEKWYLVLSKARLMGMTASANPGVYTGVKSPLSVPEPAGSWL
jgi:hypothetical protein